MELHDLFARDIYRNINPAVVVRELNNSTVKIEIEEYVFTADLIDSMYKFIAALFNKKDGKTAIWVSGFYGSGKSHFIKYIYYCINEETSDIAFSHFIRNAKELIKDDFLDCTPSNIAQLQKKIQASKIDKIMFNIDSVSGQRETREKITLIMLNQLNNFRGYNSSNIQLALLVEKYLDKAGKLSAFKEKMTEIDDYDWDKDASRLFAWRLDTVLEIVKSLIPSTDIESLKHKLNNPDDISIAGVLIPELLDFLADKPDDYRLVFLIDEVSQYIGTNTNLLLNLQTIIEEIGAQCGNKVWIATTAQQSLIEIIGNADSNSENFGKILGRFDTKISLQSQDAAYITKKRILDKGSDGIGILKPFYDKNIDAIQNQFHFSHDLYKGFDNYENFLLAYPFIPYQFRLISDVFDSFSKLEYVDRGVRNSERSVLGITHYTIGKHGNEKLGYFIPFDAFFNEQFRKNLTNTAIQIIDRATSLDFVKENSFAKRVVYALFMISNLSDEKKIIFPTNLDNLTVLLMNQPDINKLELQKEIQGILEKLTALNIIREENGQFNFFKEDEIDVANLIQNTIINTDDRLSALESNIFTDMIGLKKKFSFNNNSFSISLSFDDKNIYSSGDISVRFNFFDHEDINKKALGMNKNDIVFCLNVPLNENKILLRNFNSYIKTSKYIRQNSDSATGTRKKTIAEFANRNRTSLDEIKTQFRDLFAKAPIISAQTVISASELSGREPKQRYEQAMMKHFTNVYKKNSLASHYADNSEVLRKAANSNQMSLPDSLTDAENEVNNWIDRQGMVIPLEEVIKHFQRAPYGWNDNAVMDVLIKISKKNKKQFERNHEKIDTIDFFIYGIRKPERSVIVIKSIEIIDPIEIDDAKNHYFEIFNERLSSSDNGNQIHEEIIKNLQNHIKLVKSCSNNYSEHQFNKHILNYLNKLEDLVNIREPKRLFERLGDDVSPLTKMRDVFEELNDFLNTNYDSYIEIKTFAKDNKQNFSNLDTAFISKAETLNQYLESESLPSGRFPQMRKIYEELVTAVGTLKKELQNNAVSTYEKIYDTVEGDITTSGISDLIITPRQEKVMEIKAEENIDKIKLMIGDAASYKAIILAEIEKSSGKKSFTFKLNASDLPSKIETEEELNNYLERLGKKLLNYLKNGNTIILE